MAFAGYLLKSGNDVFPHQYIELGSYESTPDQREEIKAERDDNSRDLIRVTAAGMKTSIHFKTRDNLTYTEKEAICNWFYSHETDHKERKISITFWNDDPYNATTRTADYETAYFYRPNLKFSIKRIEGNNIIYGALEIDLIEY